MNKNKLLIALFFGLSSILLGAFGAHALRPYFTANLMDSFETGVHYQQFMSLFLMLLALNESKLIGKLWKNTFRFAAIGTALFSGSIYFLCLNKGIWNFEVSVLVPVLTPIGGMLMMCSWLMLIIQLYLTKKA